ncbi:hypothetical protein LG293_16545 (plasmid) [Citricoccus nitrophenolicus]
MSKPASTSHGLPGTAPRYTMLFRTVQGSRLHGFSRPESDLDLYEVWDDLGHKGHRIFKRGGRDVVRVDLETFLEHLRHGVPRAVEARYAPTWAVQYEASWFRAFRHALVPGAGAVAEGYRRTIDHIWRDARDKGVGLTPKQQRHAARLEHDRHFFLTHGHLDPTAFARTLDAHRYQYTDTKELHLV